MADQRLAGRVTVVPLGDTAGRLGPELARRLAAGGATVVLVTDAEGSAEAGRLAADIETSSAGRAAVFAGSDIDALVLFVAELFA